MTPDWIFFVSSLFLYGIPIIILAVGFTLFFIKFKHRRMIGAILVLLGSLELSFWLIVTNGLIFSGIVVYLMTIILGIVSLLFANKTPKN